MIRPTCPEWTPRVLTCSALEGEGIMEVWQAIGEFNNLRAESGGIEQRRADQARAWMWSEIDEGLRARLHDHKSVEEMIGGLEADVAAGKMTPTTAAQKILGVFLGG
jgi:LAO/AO transport system kinase